MLPISKIRRDGGAQSRESIDRRVVASYADDMDRGDVFPPLDVFHDGAAYWLSRGHHRIEAAEQLGRDCIGCIIHPGTKRDAILHAVGDNAAHGCRHTDADKRRCVLLLLADGQWRRWSDRKIGETAHVSHPFVAKVRREAGDSAASAERLVTRNGTTYPMSIAPRGAAAAAATGIDSPLKWHGGKQPLARRIVALMPPHTTYVEAYAGSLAVLFAKSPEGVSEIVNDIDGALVNFWNVLREPKAFARLLRMAQATPFSESTWKACEDHLKAADPVCRAWAFFVRCRQSLAGRMKSFSPLSFTRTRRGMNEQAAAWLTSVDGLAPAHERLKRVATLSRDAIDVIRQHDAADTLFYLDPPYVPLSRATPDVYAHEMTIEQHEQLLATIAKCKGKIILSGYPNDLYAGTLRDGWQRIDIDRANSAAGGDSKRRMTEALWLNFPLPPASAAVAQAERKSA
ncbi:MAG: adenine methylase [Phycisphaerales bacterium]|nr:adenine methylase [Phycisphaerales bacterium]